MKSSATDLAGLLTRHPWPVLGLFLLLLAGLAPQLRHFEIDASAETLLSEHNRKYLRGLQVRQRFAPEEFLLIAYQPLDGDVLSEQHREQLAALSRELGQLERVTAVRSILNVPLISLAGSQLGSDLDPAQWTLQNRDFPREDVVRALTAHPLYQDLLVNDDLSVTALQLVFRTPKQLREVNRQVHAIQIQRLDGKLSPAEEQDLQALQDRAAPLNRALNQQRRQEMRRIREIVATYETTADLYIGGAHALADQLTRIVAADLRIFGSAVAIMVGLILWLVFRNWRWVVLPLVSCGVSVMTTISLFGLLQWKATVISANFIALQLILGLALSVHLMVHYRQAHVAHPDAEHNDLIAQVLREKLSPCIYAVLTTSVGFAVLLVSDIEPIIAFGRMMIVASLVTLLTSLLLFPVLMRLLGQPRDAQDAPAVGTVLSWLQSRAQRSGGWTLLLSGLVLIASLAGMTRLDVENSFIDYFAESTPVHRELSFIDRELGGTTPLDMTYSATRSADDQDLAFTREEIRKLQLLQSRLKDEPAVGKTLSVVNFAQLAKRLNDHKPLTEYELTALYRLIDADLRDSLLGGFYDRETRQYRLNVRIQDTTPGLDREQFLARLRTTLDELGFEPGRYQLSNLFVLYQDLLQRLYRSQFLTLGLIYLATGLIFWLSFRSPRRALIALAPNILATLAVLGLMGWLAIPLDFMTITITAIAMGISVDDSIHYMHRYLSERRQTDAAAAVRNTQHSVGFAVAYTSLIVALGFSLLTFSDFVPSVLFGALSALAMLLALAGNLVLLPALILRYDKRETRRLQ